MKVIDAHAHIFSGIDGIKRGKKTSTGKFGRIKWKDEELVFLPPVFRETCFTADMLIESMDFSGISKAVLLQNPVIGIINKEIRNAIEKYPTRFVGTIQVDPMISDACKIIAEFASEKQNTLKLEISEEWGWSGNYPGFSLTGKEMNLVWETVARLDLNVIIDSGDVFNKGYQVENLRIVAQRFPEINLLIEHLAFFREDIRLDNKALNRRNEMLSLANDFKNIFLGFSSTAAFINDDYPCIKALELLKEAVEIVGAEKILWGSDIPSTFKRYTYSQLINVVAKHATFLNESEKTAILYGNAERFFFS